MATTTLLVEIIIVGISFFVTICPVIAIIFQADIRTIFLFYSKIPILFQLAATYAAGVFWNRICDQIFHLIDKRIITAQFASRERYQEARIKVILQNETMKNYIGDYRSLIRVSRASSVLLFVYVVFTPLYFFHVSPLYSFSITHKLIVLVFELMLLFSSVYAWVRLVKGYVAALDDAANLISNKEKADCNQVIKD